MEVRLILNVVGLYQSTSAVLLVIMILISLGDVSSNNQQPGIIESISIKSNLNATLIQVIATPTIHSSMATKVSSLNMATPSCLVMPCQMHVVSSTVTNEQYKSRTMSLSKSYNLKSSSSHTLAIASVSSSQYINTSGSPNVKPPGSQGEDKEDRNAVYLVLGVSGTLFVIVLIIVGFCMKGKCRARRPLEPISSWVTTETGADELLGSHESIELGSSRDVLKRKGITNHALDRDDESNLGNAAHVVLDMEPKKAENETPLPGSDSPNAATNPALQRYISIRLLQQEWLTDYKDQASKAYCQLTTGVESEIKHLYANVHMLNTVNTLNVREGSVIIDLLLTFIAVCNYDPLSPLIVAVKKGRFGQFKVDPSYDLQQPFGQRIGRRSKRRQRISKGSPHLVSPVTTQSLANSNIDNEHYADNKQNTTTSPVIQKQDENIHKKKEVSVINKKEDEQLLNSNSNAKGNISKGVVQFVASANFVPSDSREVQLVIGEPVEIIARDQSGWTKVLKKNNDIGWVPASFLERVSSRHLQSTLETVKTLHLFDQMLLAYDTSSGDSSSEASKGGSVDDDLYLKPIRDKIKKTEEITTPHHPTKIQRQQQPSVAEITNGDQYCALFDYNSGEDGELSLRVGDVIDIIQISESGWWRGNCKNSIGWFPSSYVQVLDEAKVGRKAKFKRSLSDGDEREKTVSDSDPRSPEYMDLVRSFVPPRKYSGLYVDLIKRTAPKKSTNEYSEPIYTKPMGVVPSKDRSITVVDEEQSVYSEIDDKPSSLPKPKEDHTASSGPLLPDRPAPSPQHRKGDIPELPQEAPPRLRQSKRPMSIPGSHGEPPKRPVPPPPSKHSRRSSAAAVSSMTTADRTGSSFRNLAVLHPDNPTETLASTPRRGLSRSMNEINSSEQRRDPAIARKRPLSLIGPRSPPMKPLPQLDRADGPEVPTRKGKAINIKLLKEQLGENIVNRVGQERRSRSNRPHSTPNINLDQLRKANERFVPPSSRDNMGRRYTAVEEEGSNLEGGTNEESSKKKSLRRNVSRSLSDASPLSSPVGNPSLEELNNERITAKEVPRDTNAGGLIISSDPTKRVTKHPVKESKTRTIQDYSDTRTIDDQHPPISANHTPREHRKQKNKKPIPLPRTQQA